MEQFVFVRPNVKLLTQFGNNEESSPSSNFLALENIAENVIADVQNVFALGTNQRCEDIAGATRVNLAFLKQTEISSDFECAGRRVDLSQNCALPEEQRLLGVNDDDVEVGFPVSMSVLSSWSVRKVKQIRHDFVGELVVTVGEQENLRARLANSVENKRQARIFLHIKVEVFDRLGLQFAMNVNPVDGVAHVLKDRLE